MKLLHLLFFLLMSGILVFCTVEIPAEEPAGSANEPGIRLLLFLDKTVSPELLDAKQAVFIEAIAEKLGSMGSGSDRFHACFLDAQSGLRSCYFAATSDMYHSAQVGGGIYRLLSAQAEPDSAAIQERFRNTCLAKIREGLRAPYQPDSIPHTDLWTSIELMSRFFKDAGPQDQKLVFLLTDLVEDMPGDSRRQFSQNPPEDAAEARSWASLDVQWVRKHLHVDSASLAGTQVILPALELPGQQPLQAYWQQLFEGLGIGMLEYL